MGNLISNSAINRFVVYCTLGAFALTALTPLQAIPKEKGQNMSLNDFNFGIKIGKHIKKAKNYFLEKNSRKLTDVMWDIKHEIESYTKKKINIDDHLNWIEKEAKKRGKPVDSVYMNEMRRRLRNHKKGLNHKAAYLATCMEYDLPYSSEEEDILFQNDLAISTEYKMAEHFNEKHQNKDETVLPLRVSIGVTMSLIGLFLYVVPHPACRAAAPLGFLDTGLAFLLDQGITEWENRQKNI